MAARLDEARFARVRSARRRSAPGSGRFPAVSAISIVPNTPPTRTLDRREFLRETGGALAAMAYTGPATLGALGASRAAARIRYAYAAITWGGNDPQAIDDIAALGFGGIQLRDSAVRRWGEKPDELKAVLASRQLTLVTLSSGSVTLDPGKLDANLALHVSNARFLQQVGGLYLQVTDERPAGRQPVPDDYRRMGWALSELGRRTADLGITLALHPHMGALSQSPAEVRRVMDASDSRLVRMGLDVAHYAQAGGDPVEAVRGYAGRLLFLHIKDVESPLPGGAPESYRFVELGRGRVDLPGVFDALKAVGFDGWAIVELDEVPDKARSPKESAEISKQYLRGLGLIEF
jgi:inosose dehydratase